MTAENISTKASKEILVSVQIHASNETAVNSETALGMPEHLGQLSLSHYYNK